LLGQDGLFAQPGSNGLTAATKAGHEWFADSPFNLLVDYYPEVPFRPYGSGATPENVLPVLRELQLGCIVIYAKGHSGTTTFPSSLRTEHPMLGRDVPAAFRDYTRQTGTRLFLYYSGMLDGAAGERHPDWRQLHRDGSPMRHFPGFESFIAWGICPLSGYFDEWVAVHLREMLTRYDPDGIWVDGDWSGPCYCARCEERFRKDSGHQGSMPAYNVLTPAGEAWMRTWAQITHEWRTRFSRFIKSLKPDCMYSAGNVSPRREFLAPFDWRSGDWFSPGNHRLHMSVTARRYATTGLPYDAYTCDTQFVHGWQQMRSRSKPLDRMLQEGATLLANGATWGYWTFPMPHGALVPSKMRVAATAAKFARSRRDVCLHTRFVPVTAVVNTDCGATIASDLSPALMGAGKALLALHRSPVFMDEAGAEGGLPYELIVLPEMPCVPPELGRRLQNYVEDGGRLLTCGDTIRSPEMQSLLGVRLVKAGEVNDGHVLLRTGAPAGVFADWDRLERQEAEELYPLYLSWDHANPQINKITNNWPIHGMVDEEKPEPAGFPAATVRRLGKGQVIHVATNAFSHYWTFGTPELLAWFRELLETAVADPLMRTDAPSFIELSLREKDGNLLIHVINGNPGRDISLVGTNDLWVTDIPAVGPYEFQVRCAAAPRAVRQEPGGGRLEHRFKDGRLTVILPRVEIHTCIVVEARQPPMP
jgi:hypothetical protein